MSAEPDGLSPVGALAGNSVRSARPIEVDRRHACPAPEGDDVLVGDGDPLPIGGPGGSISRFPTGLGAGVKHPAAPRSRRRRDRAALDADPLSRTSRPRELERRRGAPVQTDDHTRLLGAAQYRTGGQCPDDSRL